MSFKHIYLLYVINTVGNFMSEEEKGAKTKKTPEQCFDNSITLFFALAHTLATYALTARSVCVYQNIFQFFPLFGVAFMNMRTHIRKCNRAWNWKRLCYPLAYFGLSVALLEFEAKNNNKSRTLFFRQQQNKKMNRKKWNAFVLLPEIYCSRKKCAPFYSRKKILHMVEGCAVLYMNLFSL